MAAIREAVELEYSITGIWLSMPRGNADILNLICMCLKLKTCHTKKAKKHIKKPCAFTIIFLQ